jgi:hypothetical protein
MSCLTYGRRIGTVQMSLCFPVAAWLAVGPSFLPSSIVLASSCSTRGSYLAVASSSAPGPGVKIGALFLSEAMQSERCGTRVLFLAVLCLGLMIRCCMILTVQINFELPLCEIYASMNLSPFTNGERFSSGGFSIWW